MGTMEKIQSVQGMHDILPDEHDYFTFIKKVVRHRCRQNGIRRITTPVVEETALFQRAIGEQTDIVEKEMYTFIDKGEKQLTLRPEGTAGVVRAYIEHGMSNLPQPVQLYYFEPMFRRERPQKGRYRQLFQFGVEIMGESDPALDAQLIALAYTICQDLGIADMVDVVINSIGCPVCRPKYITHLQNFYAGKERNLCDKCKIRLGKNPLRLLDCKEEDCQILANLAPKITDHLCSECHRFHDYLKEYLHILDIPFRESPQLVRGLDYYTKTVFELILKNDPKAQNAVCGGGRYDKLVELLGGANTPASGFAFGIDRVVMTMRDAGILVPSKDTIHVVIIQLGEDAKKKAIRLLQDLRSKGIKAMGSFGKDSIKSQLRLADKLEAPYALILGQMEVKNKTIILRDMKKGTQTIIKYDDVIPEILKTIDNKTLDTNDFSAELTRL
jgi:histidyl-tRNA synthetase